MRLTLCFFIALSLWFIAATSSAQTDSSTDGWQVINLDTDAFIGHICFASHDTVLGGGQVIIRSTDAGLTWDEWATPTTIGAPYFRNPNFGYLLAQRDTIFRTVNAGMNWDTLHSTVPSFTSDLQVVTPSFLVVTSLSWVDRSTDSGNTWQVQELNTPGLNAISFADSLNGFVVGDFQLGPEQGQQGAGCFRTSNGGVTWSQVYTGFQGDLTAVYAFSGKEVLAAGGNTILRSNDAGQTWTPVSSGVRYATMAMDFSARYGFAVGYGGAILASSDSGKTWYEQPSHTTEDLHAVKMFDSTRAIASGENGTLLRTMNGGSSWVEYPQNKVGLNLVVSPNPAYSQIQVTYTVPTSQHVSLYLVNAIGEVVVTIVSNELEQGDVSHSMSLESLPSGSYFVVLESPSYHGFACLSVSH
jgi:photosystem II stability/assembly factor-like uncharacterized protein